MRWFVKFPFWNWANTHKHPSAEQDQALDQFIGDEIVEGARLWVNFAAENYDAKNDELRPLDPENEDDQAIAQWEVEEKARFVELKEQMDTALETTEESNMVCDIDYARVERGLRTIMTDENGLVKMTLPDLPWNGGRGSDLEVSVLGMMGEILMSARNAGIRGIFTLVVNRNHLLALKDGPTSQNALNGDPRVAASWMHNFPLAFKMDFQKTKSAIPHTVILDRGSKMPVKDETTNTWDWSNDQQYKGGVIKFTRSVDASLCMHM